jgi:hypothetical protein
MTMDEYIRTNYDKYLTYAKNMEHGSIEDYRDICNEAVLYIYEMTKEKREKIYKKGYLDWYIIKMISQSYSSNTGYYNRKYNMVKYDKNFDVDIDLEIEELQEPDGDDERLKYIFYILVNKCSYYQQQVFIQYHFKHGSFRKFQTATGIRESQLWKTYQEVKKIIEDNLFLLKNND